MKKQAIFGVQPSFQVLDTATIKIGTAILAHLHPEGESEPFDDDFSQKKYARYPKMLYGVKMDTSSF